MKAPRKINLDAQAHMVREALPLLTPAAQEFFSTVCVVMTDSKSGGRAWPQHQVARVPSWVFQDRVKFCNRQWIDGGAEFCAYYAAHEMAHLKARTPRHGALFLAAFREFCPLRLRWYETIYKTRSKAVLL